MTRGRCVRGRPRTATSDGAPARRREGSTLLAAACTESMVWVHAWLPCFGAASYQRGSEETPAELGEETPEERQRSSPVSCAGRRRVAAAQGPVTTPPVNQAVRPTRMSGTNKWPAVHVSSI